MSFNVLPSEIIHLILNRLSLNEILKCRRLNKRCKMEVGRYKLTRLASFNCSDNPGLNFFETERFAFTNELINDSHVYRSRSLRCFGSYLMHNLLAGCLRKLAIVEMFVAEQFLPLIFCLNQLYSLEHLHIDRLHVAGQVTFDLWHIKTFSVNRLISPVLDEHGVNSLNIITPELTQLALLNGSCVAISVANRLAITHLAIGGHFALSYLTGFGAELRYLHMQHILPKMGAIFTRTGLEEIHFYTTDQAMIRHVIDCKNNPLSERHSDKPIDSKRWAAWTPNPTLRLYFHGVQIDSLADVDALFANGRDLETISSEYIAANYSRFRMVDTELVVNYSELISHFVGCKLPTDFFAKFVNIVSVEVGLTVDPGHFAHFLKHCPALERLSVMWAPLNQEFYDRLHHYADNLTTLKIIVDPRLITSPTFLLHQRSLRTLTTNIQLERTTIINLFQNPKMTNVEFWTADGSYYELTRNEFGGGFLCKAIQQNVVRHSGARESLSDAMAAMQL